MKLASKTRSVQPGMLFQLNTTEAIVFNTSIRLSSIISLEKPKKS